jgi:uncharacterized protein YbaP (TraB family)
MSGRGLVARVTFCALLALTGCAATGPKPGAGPALWVVRSQSATVYLFGTMHILPIPVAWETKTIQNAFSESSELWTETDVSDLHAVARAYRARGISPDYDLPAALGAAHWAVFSAELTKCGVAPDKATHMRPWFAGVLFQACAAKASPRPQTTAIGYAAMPDRFLVEQAKTENKSLHYLEPLDSQVAVLVRRPDAEQLPLLIKQIDARGAAPPDPARVKQRVSVLTAVEIAWAHGNLGPVSARAEAEMQRQDPAFHDALLTHRNQIFVTSIAQTLQRSTTAFVAMGAFHLIGQDSVLDSLAKLGFTAERIE